MYIECFKNNGKNYLRLVENKRITNSNGIKTSTKKVVYNIGPLYKFDDGLPNYVERLKNSYKAGNPIIPELLPYCKENCLKKVYRFSLNEGSPDCFGHPKIFSLILFEKIIEELGLRTFFSSYKGFSKIKYDVYGFFKLLTFGRVLNPSSKSATVKQNNDYYIPILSENYNPDNVYDTLDFIYDNKARITKRINTSLVNKAKRNPKTLFYDVTNFYFEIENPDEDILDEEGNILVKGLRKNGVCKEERKLPIAQMGLFMDDDGIPIAIEGFSGNTLDHQTLKTSLKNNIDDLEFSRFILISDRGIFQYQNLLYVLDAGNGYIVSKSLLKSKKEEQDWTYDDKDYIKPSENFKYKSRILKRTLKDENGNKRTIEEQIVVYWSKKYKDRMEKENKSFLEFLTKLEETPENFRITSSQQKSLKKFLKKDYVNTKTGEILNSRDIKPLIDFKKVNEYKESFGYYQIVTSELTMPPLEVIDKYHNLTQIEEQFRIMKGSLMTRPIYVRTREHIIAHLLICMIALIVVRIIQNKIISFGKVKIDESSYWSTGLNSERIQKALNKWQVDKLPDDTFRFMNVDDEDLKLILDSFHINIPAKLYNIQELKGIKKQIKIFK